MHESLVAGRLVAFFSNVSPSATDCPDLTEETVRLQRTRWEWLLLNQTVFCGIMPGMQRGRKPERKKQQKESRHVTKCTPSFIRDRVRLTK